MLRCLQWLSAPVADTRCAGCQCLSALLNTVQCVRVGLFSGYVLVCTAELFNGYVFVCTAELFSGYV